MPYKYRHAAKRIQRAYRRYKTKRRPRKKGSTLSNKKLTKAVRNLQKESEIRRYYSHLDNVRVSNGNGLVQNGSFIVLNLCRIPPMTPEGITPVVALGRSQNAIKLNVKNLHIRFSMHASEGEALDDTNKYAVYLIRSTLTDGATDSEVRPPTLAEFFDNEADFTSTGNLLQPEIDGFRNSIDDAIKSIKVLKKWTGTLTPADYQVSDANPAAGTAYNYLVPTINYKPQHTIHYSTRQLNAEITFQNSLSSTPNIQAYYLIAVTNTSETRAEYLRWNVVVATTFKDD